MAGEPWIGRRLDFLLQEMLREANTLGAKSQDAALAHRVVAIKVELERLRMVHMASGYDSGDKSAVHTLAYVSFQELATRVSHRNTGAATGCPIAEQLLQRIPQAHLVPDVVSSKVNSVKNNGPELIEPVEAAPIAQKLF